MQIWQAILLGAVQGFTEFLPVSSSGHLLLLQKILGIKENAVLNAIALHVGTLIPVVALTLNEIKGILKNGKNLLYLLIATLPAGAVGLLVNSLISLDALFLQNTVFLAICFVLTALLLLITQHISKKTKTVCKFTYKNALLMGVGQALAVFPGLSRSGLTISFGVFSNAKKEKVSSFAFLMSIPIILGAITLSLIKGVNEGASVDIYPLIFGVITASVTGYIALKVTIKTIKSANYKWFSLYLLVVALLSITVN